jgi:hypothetical protein
MGGAIGIEPINLTASSEFLKVIVSKWPLDKTSPLNVTNLNAEEIVSRVLRLPDVEHGKQRIAAVLKCTSVSQVEVLTSLDNQRSFRKPGIAE